LKEGEKKRHRWKYNERREKLFGREGNGKETGQLATGIGEVQEKKWWRKSHRG